MLDQVGDRVQVDGVGLAAEAQRLQRDGSAARERVKHLGHVAVGVGVQELVGGRDELAGLADEFFVVGVLPPDEVLDELKAALARRVLAVGRFRQQFVDQRGKRVGAFGIVGVGDERGEHNRPARGQRPPRPPDVQRGDMPMPDRLLPRRLLRHLLERQCYLLILV